jgi:hypothetical protein
LRIEKLWDADSRTLSTPRHIDSKAWTHPFSTRSWMRCMRPDTPRRNERIWGWGYVHVNATGTSLYGRRTVGAAGYRKCAKGIAGQLAVAVRVDRLAHAGHATACSGRHGSRRSRIAGWMERISFTARPATAADAINDDGLCKGRSGSMNRNAASRRQLSRGSVRIGSRQQYGQSMHVSSTCGADRMEIAKEQEVGTRRGHASRSAASRCRG